MTNVDFYNLIVCSEKEVLLESIKSFRQQIEEQTKLKCTNVVQVMLNDIGWNSNP